VINFEALFGSLKSQKIQLPNYPFQRKQFWWKKQQFEVPKYWQEGKEKY